MAAKDLKDLKFLNDVERIKNILRKYFEYDDDGDPNDDYDPNFSANDAVDEIHQIVGKI